MHLVASVCVYVCTCICGQKIDLFGALPFKKKPAECIMLLDCGMKMPPKGFSTSSELYRWSMRSLCMFYLKPAVEYCIMVCHASLYTYYATCSSSARVCLREIDSTCSSAVITARVTVI